MSDKPRSEADTAHRSMESKQQGNPQGWAYQVWEKGQELKSKPTVVDSDRDAHLSYEELIELAHSHRSKFRRLGDLNDIHKAIEYDIRAVALVPDGDPDLPYRLDNLGADYIERFRRLGDIDDLAKSIEHFSRAVSLIPDGHPELPRKLANLGGSYNDRFRRLGDMSDISRSIECKSRGVALTPDGHPDLPYQLGNLGLSYGERFKRLGDMNDLTHSIECFSRAVDLTPDDHPQLPSLLANLGVVYNERFKRLDDMEDNTKSMECFSRAVDLTPSDHPHLQVQLANLGLSYSERFKRLGNIDDLSKSIEYKTRAVKLTPDGHSNLPRRLANLGVDYSDRFERLGDMNDLAKSIEYESRAVALTPEDHPELPRRHFNLAQYYVTQHQRTGDPSDFRNSMLSLRTASQSLAAAPRNKFRYALYWAQRASDHSSHDRMEAYHTVIDLLPQFIWLGATPDQQYQDLLTAQDLAVKAASTAILCSAFEQALEWLEHARCVVWNQRLMLRSPLDQLYISHPDIATSLQAAAEHLHQAGLESGAPRSLTSDLSSSKDRHSIAGEYNRLLAEARALPGFEDFLRPMKSKDLVHAARNGPIVVINPGTNGCDALIILHGRDQTHRIPLPKFSYEEALNARTEIQKSLGRWGLRERDIKFRPRVGQKQEQNNKFEEILKLLWDGIVEPVLKFLGFTQNIPTGNLPHITWCPTGPVSFLPLHAAGDYNQPNSKVYKYVVSSYTPTLTALLSTSPTTLGHGSRVLGVGLEVTSLRGYTSSKLPGTTKELGHLKEHIQKVNELGFTELTGENATASAVLDAMEQHDWVHLACHAHQNIGDPNESGFLLHDGILDLTSINSRSFKNKGLAFLSACQTATGDTKLPDEAVHLASGMLMAGYSSVIATMWSVKDADAPLVANEVYAQLMKDGKLGNGEAGRALHNAVATLRDEIGEKEFGRWVPYIHIGA
ncbi:unnamed protein product [Rhizoctonia solani]|uniref:CHAT domain-containing protein n=1 Tax=Rhizoctonia solani TaxID=456999 RepID=A0A8H2WDQ1_9AGAM|nr:unnamed protein product [Rhizoctonia solani]